MEYDYLTLINKYYPEGSPLRDIYLRHCSSVADLALTLARRNKLPIPDEQIRAAAMLHDIGIFLTDAPAIHCHGSEPYIKHGPLGAELLRREHAPEWAARVAERHTGSGIPPFLPETDLEKLICYADKFFSKSGAMTRKPFNKVEQSMARFGNDSLERFRDLASRFGKILD